MATAIFRSTAVVGVAAFGLVALIDGPMWLAVAAFVVLVLIALRLF